MLARVLFNGNYATKINIYNQKRLLFNGSTLQVCGVDSYLYPFLIAIEYSKVC